MVAVAHLFGSRDPAVCRVLSFSPMSASRRQTRLRPSRDQVRAWLTTVLAPIANALAVEERRGSGGNWSFRCETQDFEFLWPVSKMIAAPYMANLEQLLRYRQELKKRIDTHDRALNSLRTAARAAYDRIVQSELFRPLAASTAVPERERKYLAEYVVNELRDLPPHYSYHDVWNREGAQFLGLRDHPSLATEFHSLEAAGLEFVKSIKALRTAVSLLQVELADAYKLPPVDPADTARV